MSAQICQLCGKLLSHKDLVRARIITRFIGLKSKTVYALEKPSDCESISHVRCEDPKGELNGD